jgi:hypothetical protein
VGSLLIVVTILILSQGKTINLDCHQNGALHERKQRGTLDLSLALDGENKIAGLTFKPSGG